MAGKYKHLLLNKDGTFEYIFSEAMAPKLIKSEIDEKGFIKQRRFKPVGAVYEETKNK